MLPGMSNSNAMAVGEHDVVSCGSIGKAAGVHSHMSFEANAQQVGSALQLQPKAVVGPAPLALYPRVLGAAWSSLDEPVRTFHEQPGGSVGNGLFDISRCERPAGRFLATLLRLPCAGRGVPVHLTVVRNHDSEIWQRSFGETRLTTRQWQEGQFVAETAGPFLLLFELRALNGMLELHQIGTRLRFGRLSIPLPDFLSLGAVARVTGARDNTMHVHVDITLPFLGNLLHYEGNLTIEQSR